MMKKILILLACFTLIEPYCEAQNAREEFENMKKKTRSEFDGNYREKYDSIASQIRKEYTQFRKDALAEYIKFVREAWVKFDGRPGLELPKEEMVVPVLSDEANAETASWFSNLFKKKKKSGRQPKVKPVVGDGEQLNQNPVIKSEVFPQPQPEYAVSEDMSAKPNDYMPFNLFGTEYRIRIGDNCRPNLQRILEDDVADAMKVFVKPQFDNMLFDCLQEREKHKLSDWGYYLMLQTMVDTFYGKYSNDGALVLSFLFAQSGYKMRMVRDESHLYALIASKHWIYNRDYTYFDSDRYYLLDGRKLPNSVFVCQAKFSKESSMSLQMSAVQLFSPNVTPERTITSRMNPNFSFKLVSNKNYIDFYNTYPRSTIGQNFMTQWVMYAETPIEEGVRNQLYPVLRQKLQGLSQRDAAQQLLWWVQTGLEYEYDEKLWGSDRAFFGEESLFYPYCDCEDRAILFSHLVRDLLNLDVVLVYYPGHLATAVAFTEHVAGDYYTNDDGRKFTVCDPTIVPGRVGETMDLVANEKATIMLLRRL